MLSERDLINEAKDSKQKKKQEKKKNTKEKKMEDQVPSHTTEVYILKVSEADTELRLRADKKVSVLAGK